MGDQFRGSARRFGRAFTGSFDGAPARDEVEAIAELKRRQQKRHRVRSEHFKSIYEQKKLDGITLPYVSIQHKPYPVD